jgi:hypothetical protein
MIGVLDQVQVLDQQIAPPRLVAKQDLNLVGCGRIDLPAFRRRLGPLSSFARMLEGSNLLHVTGHGSVSFSWHANLVTGMPDAKNNYRVSISI